MNAGLARALRVFEAHERAKCRADIKAIQAKANAEVVARKATAAQRVAAERERLQSAGKPGAVTVADVRKAARAREHKGYGRAFVSDVWEKLTADGKAAGTLDEFKRWLLANRSAENKLRLTRAELMGALPSGKVARSEIIGPGKDELHFIAWD